jgi:hypothetical protein
MVTEGAKTVKSLTVSTIDLARSYWTTNDHAGNLNDKTDLDN